MPVMTTHVDGTIPVAEDFNGNTRRFNQAIGVNTAIVSYSPGDVLYAAATDTLTRLPAGNPGEVLTMVGGFPAWTSSGAVSGTWQQRNLQGTLSAGSLAAAADSVMLRNASLGVKVHEGVSSLTIDPATAGLNGRDQTAAFSAGQDLWAYWISNGVTIRGVWADSAPPTGPDLTTLPAFAGYTYWCPILVARWTALSTFLPAYVTGGRVTFQGRQNAFDALATANVEQAVSYSAIVPARALRVQTMQSVEGIGASEPLSIRLATGVEWFVSRTGVVATLPIFALEFPVLAGQTVYLMTRTTSRNWRMDLLGYDVPNGDA